MTQLTLRRPGGLARSAKKLATVARFGVRRRWARMSEVVFRSGFLVVTILAFSQLWRAVTDHIAPQPGGLGLRQLVWYIAVAEAIVMTTPSNLEDNLSREVRSGDIAYRIARPLAFPLFHLAAACGDRGLRFAWNFAVGAAAAYALVGPIPLRLPLMATALTAASLSAAIDELIALGVSLTSFWLEDSNGFHLLYRRATLLLGGALVPVEAYPEWLARVCRALPFAQLVAAPARLFVSADASAAPRLFATLVGFGACAGSAVWVVYRIGVRRLTAQGG